MTIRRCIPTLLGQGKINDEQAGRMKDLFDGFEGMYGDEARASSATADAFEFEAAQKRRQTMLQLRAQQKIAGDLKRFRVDRPGLAAEALLAADDRAPYRNVEFMEKAIANQHFAMMNELVHRFSRDSLGRVRDVATLNDVLREAFGEKTGNDSAKVLGKAWLETAESLRLQFNERGGAIGKMDKWGMPQVHNMLAVRASSFEDWRDFLMGTDERDGLLDRGEMTDEETGLPMTPQRLELALRSVYDTIISDGWNERTPGAFSGSKLANRHADARFLKFKDADSWLAYSQRFGRPLSRFSSRFDPGSAIYDAMISHIHGMSRDIALMERLGPNPKATLRWLQDGIQKEAHLPKYAGRKRIDQAGASADRINNMYDELTGGFPKPEHPRVAKFMAGWRAFESAAKLGSAFLSSLGDVATQYVTRRFNGLPAMRVGMEMLAGLKPSSAADRAHAARQWHIAESAIRTMGAYNRWTGEAMTGEIPGRLSNAVMHLSLLDKWTDGGRTLFNKQVWAAITDNAESDWSKIGKANPRFQRMLQRYGFNENDWNAIRSTPLQEDGGAHWILPDNVTDPDLARRVAEMALQETEMAVPSSSLRIRAKVNASLKKGSFIGEMGRSALQFRGYPLQLFWSHGRRALEEGGWGGTKYAATLFISTTIMGAMAYQLAQIASGKDIANMDPHENPDFIAQAIFKGGGLGIFGDLVQHINMKDWRNFLAENAGPVWSSVQDAGNVALSKNHGKALSSAIRSNTPGSTLWYIKLAFQREVIDQMQAMIDPQYRQSGARMEQTARQHGTKFWWKPFTKAPQRAPELSRQRPPSS